MRKHLLLPLLTFLFWGHSFAGNHPTTGFSKGTEAFTENKGQITNQYGEHRTDIQFKLLGSRGLNVFVGNGLLIYQWSGLLRPPVREERLHQHFSAP